MKKILTIALMGVVAVAMIGCFGPKVVAQDSRAIKMAEANSMKAIANALSRNFDDVPRLERAYLILPEDLGIEGLWGDIAILPPGDHSFYFRGRDITVGGGQGGSASLGGGVSVGFSTPGASIENSTVGGGTVEAGRYYKAEADATLIGGFLKSVAIVELTGEELDQARERVAEWLALREGAVIGVVTWAGTNVGEPRRFVGTPEDYGNYYSFEEAQMVCPEGWRTPTTEEFEALIDAGQQRVEIAGVSGRMFGSGDSRVFFPGGGGVVNEAGVYNPNNAGFYWSSTPKNKTAYGLTFNSVTNLIFNKAGMGMTRENGMSVRCVKK
jgi:uncharacterized protein (TIGR02145 family)